MKATSKKRVAVITTTVLVLSLFLTTAVFAESTFKNLRAWFADIKIFANNQQVQLDVKPFIVDGTTYVPLRALSNIFNKNINWDGTNYRIDITDKPDQNAANLAYMSQQLVERQIKISELEKENEKLKAELENLKKDSKYTLRELEDYLNDEYGTYEKIKFDIELSGDDKKIKVAIYVDLDDYYSRWNSLTESKIKKFLQYIVDDIEDEYSKADISGFIEDDYSGKELTSFNVNTKGKLDVKYKGSSSKTGIRALEEYLNDIYYEYNDIDFDISLSGNEDEVRLYVDTNRSNLNYLSTSQIKKYLGNICDTILDDYPYADIEGYIGDDYSEYYFYLNSSGSIVLN